MKAVYIIGLVLMSHGVFANGEDTTRTNRLVDFFKQGHFSGQIRNFTMSTINQGVLNDYVANAIGASLHYETKTWKGFKLGLNGLFVYRIFSNDLLETDPETGKSSKYELQLFDVEHPGNYTDLDRLEELYIDYKYHNWNATIGKMEVETPIVNKHDGRMKPKVFLGTKIQYKSDDLDVFAAWFSKASPRSITHWYNMGDAIGLYNNGCLPNGVPAEYHQHISSKGVGIVGTEIKTGSNWHLEVWEYFLENVANTILVNPYIQDSSWYAGVMYLNQFGVNHGGNEDIARTFFHPSLQTHALSGRVGYRQNSHQILFNVSHVFKGGSFIFPREIGMDPLYTFVPRSQMEGYGNSSAYTLSYRWHHDHWNLGVHLNRMSAAEELIYNKYDIPSYNQFNIDLNHRFSNNLDGLEMRFLYVFRKSLSNDIQVTQTFNKVNFNQINLIINFNF